MVYLCVMRLVATDPNYKYASYYTFTRLYPAFDWIIRNNSDEWTLSTTMFEEVEPSRYELVE